MAEGMSLNPGTSTVTETENERIEENRSPTVKLKLTKPKNDKKVKWDEGTVDNEHMNKKKSKCCCIYEKPRMFGESSDESGDDDCTNNCRGHKKKCYQNKPDDQDEGTSKANGECSSETP